MRKYGGRIFLIVAAVAVSLYLLYPTYHDYQLTSQLKKLSGADSLQFIEQHDAEIKDARAKRIKLGLDLQGGMRVVLEVEVTKLLEDLAKNKDDAFNQLIAEVRAQVKTSEVDPVVALRKLCETRNIRMSRYYGSLRDDNSKIASMLEDESTKAIDRAMEIVGNRVNQYGVSEPSIQKLGGQRVIVELPGVSKEEEVRQLLQGTALLEFQLLKEPEVVKRVMDAINQQLVAHGGLADSTKDSTAALAAAVTNGTGDSTAAAIDSAQANQPFYMLVNIDRRSPDEGYVLESNVDRVRRLLARDEVKRVIPPDMEFVFSARTDPRMVGKNGEKLYDLFLVKKEPELTGGVIVNAKAQMDPSYNRPIVTMEMNSDGAHEWARITGANVNKRIAVVLDHGVFSAPVVRNKIIGGHSQIEGMATIEEARLLEIVLKAGALPAPVEIVEQRSVGPSLGEDSIRAGLYSSLLATVLTVLFMFVYYRSGGLVADVALVFCLLFLLAVLAEFHGTLTLPGIAGIILTLAVAVDANVLIYERIREEQATGKTLRAAIEAGYAKAFTAIFDSNLTTFITGVILYQFGSGPVQGFALTLMIGIVASMISAIYITRVIFNVMLDSFGATVKFG